MAQPTAYVPATSFFAEEVANPALPGTELDVEFQALKTTTDEIRDNLELIQRDDGELANDSVGYDQLSSGVLSGGVYPLTTWVTATAYRHYEVIVQDDSLYRCEEAHTAGTFATDLAAGKWSLLANLPDAQISDGTVTNAKLANMSAYTLKGRNAGTTGAPSDIDISALTEKTALAGDDLFLIQDSAASNAFKKVKRSNVLMSTGTWTPTARGETTAGTGQTYYEQYGTYERIGNLVTFRFNLFTQSIGTAAGNAQIGGLPFVSANDTNGYQGCSLVFISGYVMAVNMTLVGTLINPGAQVIRIWETSQTTGGIVLPSVSKLAGVQIVGNGQYRVAA